MDSTFNPPPETLKPRRADGLGRGAMLAIFVHVCLIIALAFGVNWRASEPEGSSAELWASVPQTAAPPVPPVVQQPAPEPRPEPAPAPPPQPSTDQAARDAQIAIEEKEKRQAEERRAKEREEKQRARELEQKEREEKARQEQEKRDELERMAQQRAEKERAEKAASDKRKQELEEQRRKQEKADAQRLAKLREENLARMMGQAGGSPSSTGQAARDAGPSAGYAGRIKARIKPNIVFTEDLPGSALAEVEVRTNPDGRIIGRRLIKSSGSREWDDAVLRAIDRTEVLPRDVDGRIPSTMIIGFRPSE